MTIESLLAAFISELTSEVLLVSDSMGLARSEPGLLTAESGEILTAENGAQLSQ